MSARGRVMRRQAWLVLLAVLLLYLALLAALWFAQERLLFAPQTLPAAHRFDVAADVKEVWIDVPGARLNALHLRQPQARGVVFFLHGNAGSLDNWFVNTELYRRAQLDLFMLDYRGYGKSSGRIESEAQLHADVRAAWLSIAARYEGRKRVILGRSLGTGLAAMLAAELQPELTVLISPYTSLQALAAEHYAWVPSALLRYPLRSDQALPRVKSHVLLVHGERDALIGPQHSRQLQALVPHARMLWIANAGHNDLHQSAAYLDGLAAAFLGSPDSTP
jgi:uncharacterized protein